jgi:hypothetical protein
VDQVLPASLKENMKIFSDTMLFAARISLMAAKSGEIGVFLIRSSYEDYDRFLSILSSGYFIHSFCTKHGYNAFNPNE